MLVEMDNVFEHAQKRGAQQIASLSKNRIEIRARPFNIRLVNRHAERHVTRVDRDAKRAEKRDQVWIGQVVMHQKSCVDWVGFTLQRDVHRIGVATKIATRLKKRDVVLLRQQPGRGQACDA